MSGHKVTLGCILFNLKPTHPHPRNFRDKFRNLTLHPFSVELLTMSGPELLCLKWKDYQENMQNEFASLRESQDFTNVTLACEDGLQVEAHKLILAASSPFFQDLFRRNRHEYSMIFMRGVKSDDLVSIVDFLYYGEVNVHQDNLEAFLTLAEELKLKGLTKEESKIERGGEDKKEIKKLSQPADVDKSSLFSANNSNPSYDPASCGRGKENKFSKTNKVQTEVKGKGKGKQENQKEKQEIQFPCLLCKKKYRSYNHLNTHKMREHEEKKYMCELCDFQSSWLSHFLTHKQTKHGDK